MSETQGGDTHRKGPCCIRIQDIGVIWVIWGSFQLFIYTSLPFHFSVTWKSIQVHHPYKKRYNW